MLKRLEVKEVDETLAFLSSCLLDLKMLNWCSGDVLALLFDEESFGLISELFDCFKNFGLN